MKYQGSDVRDPGRSMEPAHPLAGVVTALRRIAFVLLLAGVAETVVWYGNVRLFYASGGTFTSFAIGVIAGTLLLASTLIVLAFVLDLLLFTNAAKTMRPDIAESRR